jgi:hypothetical protein
MEHHSVHSVHTICLKNDIFLVKGVLKSNNKRQMAQENYLISLSLIFSYTLKLRAFVRVNRALLSPLSHRRHSGISISHRILPTSIAPIILDPEILAPEFTNGTGPVLSLRGWSEVMK